MRLSSLVVAVLFLLSPLILAQHRAETGGGAASSVSSSSAPTYSGGASTSSSPSYSGSPGSSSSSSHGGSSGGYSSPSSSSTTHSSGGYSSGASGSGTSHGSGSSPHSSIDSARSHGSDSGARGHERGIRNPDTHGDSAHSNLSGVTKTTPPTKVGDNGRIPVDAKRDRTSVGTSHELGSDAKPAHRNFFLFWRHPRKDPEPDLKLSAQPPKRCKAGENCTTTIEEAKVQPPKRCKVGEVCPPEACPAGSSLNGNNVCVTTAAVPADSCPLGQEWDAQRRQCLSHTVICPGSGRWDGVRCVNDSCGDVTGRGSILAREVRGLRMRMQEACGQDPNGQVCLELAQRYSTAMQEYRMLFDGTGTACRSLLFDPLSL